MPFFPNKTFYFSELCQSMLAKCWEGAVPVILDDVLYSVPPFHLADKADSQDCQIVISW